MPTALYHTQSTRHQSYNISDNDVGYPFFASSPYEGQPYPGTPHHCPPDASDDIKAKDCPKITTLSDSVGGQGPGHVPPHISLAALTWAVEAGELYASMDDLFDYDTFDCRVIPDMLFQMVREYFPRTEGVAVEYPPPIVPEGGDFQYEFPAGNGLENQVIYIFFFLPFSFHILTLIILKQSITNI